MASRCSPNQEDSTEHDSRPLPTKSKKKDRKSPSPSAIPPLQSKLEQLAYLDQCITWSRSVDRGFLAVKFREPPQLIKILIALPSLDVEVSKKLVQILTSNIVTKPSKSSKETFKQIYVSLFNNNVFESNGPFKLLIECVISQLSSLRTKESKEFKITLETLSNIIVLFEVLIKKFPDKQHLLLTCISQLSISSGVKIIPQDLKDRIKRLTTIMNKLECTVAIDTPNSLPGKTILSETKGIKSLDNNCVKGCEEKISKINTNETEVVGFGGNSVAISNSESLTSEKEHSSISRFKQKLFILPRNRSDLAPKRRKPVSDIPYSYSCPASYFENMFQNLREEALYPMRKTIHHYFSKRCNPRFKNSMFTYENVRVESLSCSEKEGVMFDISFTPVGIQDLSRFRWHTSSRLRYGSLLCIFTMRRRGKYFDKIYFATVARRDARILSKRSCISIHFETGIPSGFDPRLEYLMIESKHYRFFHLHRCLKALQSMHPFVIPFADTILGQPSSSQRKPSYLRNSKGLGLWELTRSKIESSQKEAMNFALTNQIALLEVPNSIVQNNMSEILVRTLIFNRQKMLQSLPVTLTCHINEEIMLKRLGDIWQRQGVGLDMELYISLCISPMLVILQDRESMDVFLQSLIGVDQNLIRLDSRSSPHAGIDKQSFWEVCKRQFSTHDLPSEVRKLRRELKTLQKKLSEKGQFFRQLSRGDFDRSLLTQSDVKHLASSEHYESLFCSKSSFSKPPNTLTIEHWLSNDDILYPTEYCDDTSIPECQDCHVTYQDSTDPDDPNEYYCDDNEWDYGESESQGKVMFCNYSENEGDIYGIGGIGSFPSTSDVDEFEQSSDSDSDDGELENDFFDEIVQESSEDLNLGDKINVWEMEFSERQELYDLWEVKHRRESLKNISSTSEEIETLINQIEYTRVQMDIFAMKSSSIIATTPEEAVKYHLQLRGVKPRILIVHSSCSLRESELLPLLSETLTHFILFNTTDSTFHKYLGNIRNNSIFQRLIKIGCKPFQYSPQLTLRTEIAQLTHSYRSIESNPDLPNIKGVAKNVFFLNTMYPEHPVYTKNGTEYINEQEANFLVQFTKYLLKQGYSEKDISICTFYPAQINLFYSLLIKAKLGDLIELALITPSAVVRSKIALISIVCSNRYSDLGILNITDIVYAAFTSASEGLYVVGDADCIRAADRRALIWDAIFNELRDNVGKRMPLSCQTHHNITFVSKDRDFKKVRNGGCLTPCDIELQCGHRCLQVCHPDPHVGGECLHSCDTQPKADNKSIPNVIGSDDVLSGAENVTPIEAVSVSCDDLW